MIIVEISQFSIINNLVASGDPFIYETSELGIVDQADWWTDVFGAPDETSDDKTFIRSIYIDETNRLSPQLSYATCAANEGSFYWDQDNQKLYIHVEHDTSFYDTEFSAGSAEGYTDQDTLYIDDVEYLPLVKSFPSVAQQQDLVNYDRLSFVSGSIVLNNTAAILDWLVTTNIYGQDIFLLYIDNDDIVADEASRSDLTDLAAFYVEDYSIGLQEINIRVQDQRKANNITIPVSRFNSTDYPDIEDDYINTPIPLIYGDVRYAEAIPVDGDSTGDVTFRVAKTLTALGQIQVNEGDAWTNVTADSINLSGGTFVLDYTDCRKDSSTSGDVLGCRVLTASGEAVTYASDVIKKLNTEALDIDYNDGTYDTTEWEAEETELDDPIGVVFSKSVPLYEAIQQVQSGSGVGFRYEIKTDGRRTIRIDNRSRAITSVIGNETIRNIDTLSVNTDSELIAAIVDISYSKGWQSGRYIHLVDDSEEDTVRLAYRQTPTLETETILSTEAGAQNKADYLLDRFSTVPKTVTLELLGDQWFTLRIYDMLTLALTPGDVDFDTISVSGREFFGIWDVQVISIDPDFQSMINTVECVLVEKKVEYTNIRETTADNIRVTTTGLVRAYF